MCAQDTCMMPCVPVFSRKRAHVLHYYVLTIVIIWIRQCWGPQRQTLIIASPIIDERRCICSDHELVRDHVIAQLLAATDRFVTNSPTFKVIQDITVTLCQVVEWGVATNDRSQFTLFESVCTKQPGVMRIHTLPNGATHNNILTCESKARTVRPAPPPPHVPHQKGALFPPAIPTSYQEVFHKTQTNKNVPTDWTL